MDACGISVPLGGERLGKLVVRLEIFWRERDCPLKLFDGRGALASRLPWIDDLYLSYSQTSLWDLGDLSKPFKDSSYRPRLFYSNYDLARFFDGQLRVGVETGFGHESNGKEGEDSRSFNMLYARPTLTLGDPAGLRFFAAPLIHNYISDDENPVGAAGIRFIFNDLNAIAWLVEIKKKVETEMFTR